MEKVLTHGSLFTGIGLLDFGLCLAGLGGPAWVAEQDEWRRGILAKRFPGATQYDDVRKVGRDCEPVVCLTGGFPCKGVSTVGLRTGMDHPETVLWREMARAVGELRPRYVVVENVANILALHDGAIWGEVLGDLAALGYDVVWDCLPAAAVGAPHLRDRVLAVATDADGEGERRDRNDGRITDRRADAQGGVGGPAPDATGGNGQGPRSQREALGRAQADAPGPAADADRDGLRQQPESERGRGRAPESDGSPEVAGDADIVTAQPAGSERRGESQGAGEPLGVEWGKFGPAIERWERAFGRRAGEPLLSGVVARSARGLVRSQLSALGDGVQVQVGQLAGAYIIEREAERMRAVA